MSARTCTLTVPVEDAQPLLQQAAQDAVRASVFQWAQDFMDHHTLPKPKRKRR